MKVQLSQWGTGISSMMTEWCWEKRRSWAEGHLGATDQGGQDIVRQQDKPHRAPRKQSGSHLSCRCLPSCNHKTTNIPAFKSRYLKYSSTDELQVFHFHLSTRWNSNSLYEVIRDHRTSMFILRATDHQKNKRDFSWTNNCVISYICLKLFDTIRCESLSKIILL